MIVQYAVNLLLVLVFIFPLLFMVSASFKLSNDAIFSDMQSIRGFLPVGNLTLDNYGTVFAASPFLRFLLNSIIVSTIAVILGVFFNSMAAFALSRLKWKGQKIVLAIIIAIHLGLRIRLACGAIAYAAAILFSDTVVSPIHSSKFKVEN